MFLRNFKPFNRRKDPRFEPVVSLSLSCSYVEAGVEKECSPHVINISRGGMFVMFTEKKLYPGTAIRITFKVPGSDTEQSIKGVITRTYRRHKEHDYYSGVRFEKPREESALRLFHFLTGETT